MNLKLLEEVRACTTCATHLPFPPRPLLQMGTRARLLIIGQAPGRRAQESGIPWSDASGERLRNWLGITDETFYDPEQVAIVPMGFCYPGTWRNGDLPPRPECAPLWHQKVLEILPERGLTLLIGDYAQKYYLGKTVRSNLTETVAAFADYLPMYLPLPHPSPRNNIWLSRHPWFADDLLPLLKDRVRQLLPR